MECLRPLKILSLTILMSGRLALIFDLVSSFLFLDVNMVALFVSEGLRFLHVVPLYRNRRGSPSIKMLQGWIKEVPDGNAGRPAR